MKRMITATFLLGLLAWGVSLLIIVLGHGDLMLIGRERSFSVATNLIFLISTLGCFFWAITKARELLIPMIMAGGLWITVFLVVGLAPYVIGLFGAPSEGDIREAAQANGYSKEWIDKALHGPAISAATNYMVDVYKWQLLDEVKQPQ